MVAKYEQQIKKYFFILILVYLMNFMISKLLLFEKLEKFQVREILPVMKPIKNIFKLKNKCKKVHFQNNKDILKSNKYSERVKETNRNETKSATKR